jgi:hypothetical protein
MFLANKLYPMPLESASHMRNMKMVKIFHHQKHYGIIEADEYWFIASVDVRKIPMVIYWNWITEFYSKLQIMKVQFNWNCKPKKQKAGYLSGYSDPDSYRVVATNFVTVLRESTEVFPLKAIRWRRHTKMVL